jgi:1,2-diacylglycerol 3-alpha-glucosyltransferase
MNIAMFTNTYIPHVGGVARSVEGFSTELRRLGHRVLVIAPVFKGMDNNEIDVLRIPAMQRFNGSDFSVPVPVAGKVGKTLEKFQPDIVHSHHPYLLGDTALRAAASHGVPVVFTHHTRYEQYTHYIHGDSAVLKRFVIELVTSYCNLCNGVVAPSISVADILVRRGVKTQIEVIPTGVAPVYFSSGKRNSLKQQLGIPQDSFVIGHVGRLAPEKNLGFLARAACNYLEANPKAHFLLVGNGPTKDEVVEFFAQRGLTGRIHLLGILDRRHLAETYRAMDVFIFASQTETQGLVLAEAMASGTPVVAIDAPGVRDIVRDGKNGRIVLQEDLELFGAALEWIAQLPMLQLENLRLESHRTAENLSMEKSAGRMVDLYTRLKGSSPELGRIVESGWEKARKQIKKQLEIMRIYGNAVEDAVLWKPLHKK